MDIANPRNLRNKKARSGGERGFLPGKKPRWRLPNCMTRPKTLLLSIRDGSMGQVVSPNQKPDCPIG